jgi:two-component system chemotaxis response regulator CheY
MLHVVAVDDNNIVIQLLNATFSIDSKIEGKVFARGKELLEHVQSNHVDLFILDWNMPSHYDGRYLLEVLRETPKFANTPIIILSGDEELDLKLEAKHLGATGWIVKPFDPTKLRTLIFKLTETFPTAHEDSSSDSE